MTKIQGTPQKQWLRVSRKLSDGDYGSFEVSAELEVSLSQDANLEENFAAMDAWLTAQVAASVRGKQSNIAKQKPSQEELPLPTEEVRTPDYGDAETEIFDVDTITVEFSKTGKKYAKVKGGKWTKYGVVAWEEVLALPPLEWDLEVLDAKDYSPPKGVKAVVLMDGNTPKKVIEWV